MPSENTVIGKLTYAFRLVSTLILTSFNAFQSGREKIIGKSMDTYTVSESAGAVTLEASHHSSDPSCP